MKNPLTLMSYVAPVMAGATALLSLALDPWGEFSQDKYFNSSWHITQSCLLMLLGGALAFLMVIANVSFSRTIHYNIYCLAFCLDCYTLNYFLLSNQFLRAYLIFAGINGICSCLCN